MSIIGTIYEDVTTDVLGDMGFWQKIVTFLAVILMTNCVFTYNEDIYLLPPSASSIFCVLPEEYLEVSNETICTFTAVNSTIEMPCRKWYVKLGWMFWIQKSWIIFCDDKMKLLLSAVIYRLARVFGFIMFGLIADSFGRKKAIVIDVFGTIVLRLVITFCDSEGWFKLMLFLLSLVGSANMYMALIIVCEIASNKRRSSLIILTASPRLFAAVCSLPIANSTSNAETYNLIACIIGIIYAVLVKWLPESPHWLLYNRKIKVAEKILLNAAQQNNINYSAEFKVRPVNQRAYNCLEETTTCLKIMSIRNLRTILSISILLWALLNFLWGSVYLKVYGFGLATSMLLKIITFIGILGGFEISMSRKVMLRQLLCLNIILTSVFTISMMFFTQPTTCEIFSAMAIASGLMVNALNLIITPRLYAINVRASVFGICHAMGQLGTLISYIFYIYETLNDVVFIVLVVIVASIAVALTFMLPHVDGRELPDVLEDMDYFSELSKPLRWVTQKRRSPSKEEVEMRIHSFGSVLTDTSGLASTSMNYREHLKATKDVGKNDNKRKFWQRTLEFTRQKLQRFFHK